MIGWYHSHPGYGCWLSGIDVSTQMTNQQGQDPFLAVVIDPVRTMSSGKVEIGAFRTFPENYKPEDEGPSEYQTIPLDKIEDFGVHAKQYYALDIQFFKSALNAHLLDLLWNDYWVNTLSASPLLLNRGFVCQQISDIAEKTKGVEVHLTHRLSRFAPTEEKKGESGALVQLFKDTSKMALEQTKGLSCEIIKSVLFNQHLDMEDDHMDVENIV